MERSEQKTTRMMISYLSNYEWKYQYSIFVDLMDIELDEAKVVAVDWLPLFKNSHFRDYIRNKNKNVAMMFNMRKTTLRSHPSLERFQQYYMTIYTTDELEGLDQLNNYGDYVYNVQKRKVTAYKIETTCNAIKTQRLHDLSSLDGMKRYSILNKKMLIPIES